MKILPVIYIQQQLNSLRSQLILDKIKKVSTLQFAAIALIVDLPSQRAVQVDKLAQSIQKMCKIKDVPIYGFTSSYCSPQSYYMLSISDKIFASQTTLFTFRRQNKRVSYDQFYQRFHLDKITVGSRQNLVGKYIDAFTPPDMVRFGNKKTSDIDERLIRYSLINRNSKIQRFSLRPQQVPAVLLGQIAKQKQLIDGFGAYEQILRTHFPDAQILKIQSASEIGSLFKSLAFVTSPILLMLFLFKVLLKYSILMYIWMKAKATGKKNLADVVQQGGYQLDEQQTQWIKQYDQANKEQGQQSPTTV